MEYVYLIATIICVAGQFLSTKLYQKKQRSSLLSSLLFFVVTSLIGALFFVVANGFKIKFSAFSITYALMLAVTMLFYSILSIKILSLGNVAIYSMFMMLGGMLLPFIYGIIFLNEKLTICKCIGIILLSGFLIFQVFGEKSNQKSKKGFYILCFLIFIINGLTSILSKAHQINNLAVDTASFTIIRYLISFIIGLVAVLICYLLNKKDTNSMEIVKDTLKLKKLGIMLLFTLASGVGSFLILLSAIKIPASILYPIVSGGSIVLSAVAARIFYKEKISKISLICIIGASISTVLFIF